MVWGEEAADMPPSFHEVQDLDATNQAAVEGYREGPGVEAPQGTHG